MTDAIAWALVHFLWQGTALALVAALLMRLASAASVRYMIGVATLAAMVCAVGLTAARTRTADLVRSPTGLAVQGSTGSKVQGSIAPSVQGSSGPGVQSPGGRAAPELPTTWIFAAWIIGVIVLSVRALGGWWVARRVAREAITPLSDELQAVARNLAPRLGVHRVVAVYASSRVSVPVMIGWLRPVVLMPPAALSGLSIAQVEAIFAHEFAHIRRHDYLVNLLQTAVETALFFHPAVWWISRAIRRDRELCCDDLAVSVSDRLTYATALSALAHIQPPSLALAATDGSLRDRVRRIVSSSPSSESAKGGWMALLPLLLVVSLAAPSAFTQTAVAPPTVVPPVVQQAAPQPPRAQPVVITADNDMVHMQTPNGDIQAKRIEVQLGPGKNLLVEELLDEQLAIERQRLELEKERLQNDSALELRSLELSVQNNESQLEEIRKKVQAGTESAVTLRNWEHAQKLNVAKLETARRALALKLEDLALRQQELTLKRRMQKAGMNVPEGASMELQAPPPPLPQAPPAERMSEVTIQGLVQRPGEHRLGADQMTVMKAIAAVGGLLPRAGDIEIRRSGVSQALSLTRTQVEAGDDLDLVDGDAVIVRQAPVFYVNGQVGAPGMKTWKPGMIVAEAVALAGGMTVKGRYGHIERPVKDEQRRIIRYERISNLKKDTLILPDDQLVIATCQTVGDPSDPCR